MWRIVYVLPAPLRRVFWWWQIWAKRDLKNWLTRTILRKPAPTRAERRAKIRDHRRAFENRMFFGPPT